MTPFNAPKLSQEPPQPPARRNLSLLQDKDIHYNGQPVAVVVAKSLNEAKAAAALLKFKYSPKPSRIRFQDRQSEARWPKNPGKEPAGNHRGDVQAGFAEIDYPAERLHYVVGKVEDTVPAGAPEQLAILRLDTDWYESTKHELTTLYSRLAPGGASRATGAW